MNLYQIPKAYRAWAQVVEENHGELNDELESMWQSIHDTLEEKAEAVAALVREAEAEEDAFRKEATRLEHAARAAANRGRTLRTLLLEAMLATGTRHLKGPRFSLTVKDASVPSIRWTGPGDPPEWAQRKSVELDGMKVHDAYNRGNSLEGFTVSYSRVLHIR